MTHASQLDVPADLRRTGRRAGYVIGFVVNLVLLGIVQNILGWGWLPFLTDEFATVVPWISFSLIVSMAMNAVYLVDDRPDTRSFGNIGLNLISLVATYQIWQVFPFDFSMYAFDWDPVTRILLVLAMVGSAVAIVAEGWRLAERHLSDKGGSG